MESTASHSEKESEPHLSGITPCLAFQCSDQCCMYGADVEIDEYQTLIAHRLAVPDEFTGPEEDEGVLLYRTALGARGCVFLLPERGCRLHHTSFKPLVCQVFPRDAEEAREAFEDGYLPCVARSFSGGNGRRKKRSTAKEKIAA